MRPEVITAISRLLEVMETGGEVYLIAKMSPAAMDALAVAGAELEDLEDGGNREPGDERLI